ncbi:hypothetical protein C1645_823705 [Glomus cerebriforme]|uniref:HTH myb-type domain-containing protein n=1 Tax=Glomus cerebriforme TaxID=658196 RepID=A0A397SWV3_9GLOM|nr:hypothetical protein C1645_823705 [Glomus cerebriforme]
MSLFDEESNRLIRKYMKEYAHIRNRFVLISKLVPKYKPNQLSNCWHNYLDPNLCLDPLTDDEKDFIIKQVQNNRKPNGIINWKLVVHNLKNEFGLLRSENKVRNFWNSRQKSNLRKAKIQKKISHPYIWVEEKIQEKNHDVVHSDLSLLPKPRFDDKIYQKYPSTLPILEPNVSLDFNIFNTPNRMHPFF